MNTLSRSTSATHVVCLDFFSSAASWSDRESSAVLSTRTIFAAPILTPVIALEHGDVGDSPDDHGAPSEERAWGKLARKARVKWLQENP